MAAMLTTLFFVPAAATCKASTGSAVTGAVILLGLVGGVIALAIANGTARSRLAAANAELGRLHQWIAGTGGPEVAGSAAVPPQWSPDPSGRHQLRYWDGGSWSHHVADGGVPSVDPPE